MRRWRYRGPQGARRAQIGYDASGNVIGVKPPERPWHTFEYTDVNALEYYVAPDVGEPSRTTEEKGVRTHHMSYGATPMARTAISRHGEAGDRASWFGVPQGRLRSSLWLYDK
ncbi:MAG: hypothetical protein PHU25_18285 [Deltaproteobacteria bacterium]|nr:hypothetical protein [Deltaproteobacteria bacterium]